MAGSGADRASASMFPIEEEEADRVLAVAMAAAFAGDPVSRVEFPNRGYQATMKFLLDSHTIVAYRIPASGLRADGERVSGFYFEVSANGTMPISGGNKANQVYDRIIAEASALADPLPMTR